MDTQQTRQGIGYALGAYFLWGVAPAYFKLVKVVPPLEIMTHRVIWSALFMLLLITLSRNWNQVCSVMRQPKKVLLLAFTAFTIGGNWLLYIWAVNNQHILEASLGYFISPLFNVVLGMLFMRERFRPLQWLAVLLAALGVLVQLWKFGSVPMIALGLALTFAFYGLMRKKIQVDAQSGMLIETLWMFPLAAIYLFGFADSATSHLSANPISLNLKLVAAGIVTTVPLMLFAAACTRLRLSTIGFFQYLGPTLMFLLAVVFYGETVTPDKMVTFGFIWLALAFFIVDAAIASARTRVRVA
ncbi:EamA family transporter RarD [Pantoea phytobeneficialis]|uniref:EamA family transporter RarD n=1 Tax=Pantoea phytobeneficialis TaxID=2052056 RepID=A0AAP9KMN5_9GAMM|nr:EamA family transporter RarD [Pantoea phytobeneficialis]MDO6409100.1 EamA family transporter RarD [Pantoea phytobeneficialis]QGR05036.1 protein RarD [Pantoea phytobeneficialis]